MNNQKSIFQRQVPLSLALLIIAIAAAIIYGILFLKIREEYRVTVTYNDYDPESYPVSNPVVFTSYPVAQDFKSETIQSTFRIVEPSESNIEGHYFLLVDDSGKDIYKWKVLTNIGFGGPNCSTIGANNKLDYSPDGNYFIACIASAVGVERQSVPLVFDKDGNLVLDFVNVKDFPIKKSIDSLGTEFYYATNSYTLVWETNNLLKLIIKNADGTNQSFEIAVN